MPASRGRAGRGRPPASVGSDDTITNDTRRHRIAILRSGLAKLPAGRWRTAVGHAIIEESGDATGAQRDAEEPMTAISGSPDQAAGPARAGTAELLYGGAASRRLTVRDIAAAKASGEKWPMLTAYDALTARVFDDAGIPVLLVGDSAAMVVYGHDSTIPVTVDDLIPLTAAVVRGSKRAMVVADLPFGSYQISPGEALATASRFLKEAGAHAVKLEGGQRVVRQVEELVQAGVPVMAHLGLTPQSVNRSEE